MALISSGMEKVRAFELPGGIWADGTSVGAPRIALVRWHSCWSDKFYQVYVNGQYAGATVDCQQRQILVQVPSCLETAVRIEVFAVEANQAHIGFGDEVDSSSGQTGRMRITFLRGQNLPIDSTAQIYSDNGTGEIDYDNPLSFSPIRIWPAWQDKAGFGMSRFGESDFGYDSAAAVGFGMGSFGKGQFGLDADIFEWVSRPFAAGVYKFAVKITDRVGNESISSKTSEITVTPAARPAERVEILAFDKQTNQLLLGVS
jgi:hypothetical protein